MFKIENGGSNMANDFFSIKWIYWKFVMLLLVRLGYLIGNQILKLEIVGIK